MLSSAAVIVAVNEDGKVPGGRAPRGRRRGRRGGALPASREWLGATETAQAPRHDSWREGCQSLMHGESGGGQAIRRSSRPSARRSRGACRRCAAQGLQGRRKAYASQRNDRSGPECREEAQSCSRRTRPSTCSPTIQRRLLSDLPRLSEPAHRRRARLAPLYSRVDGGVPRSTRSPPTASHVPTDAPAPSAPLVPGPPGSTCSKNSWLSPLNS